MQEWVASVCACQLVLAPELALSPSSVPAVFVCSAIALRLIVFVLLSAAPIVHLISWTVALPLLPHLSLFLMVRSETSQVWARGHWAIFEASAAAVAPAPRLTACLLACLEMTLVA